MIRCHIWISKDQQWSDNKQTNKREAHVQQSQRGATTLNIKLVDEIKGVRVQPVCWQADSWMVLSGFWLVPVSPPPECELKLQHGVLIWSAASHFITLTSDWLYVGLLMCVCVCCVFLCVVCWRRAVVPQFQPPAVSAGVGSSELITVHCSAPEFCHIFVVFTSCLASESDNLCVPVTTRHSQQLGVLCLDG